MRPSRRLGELGIAVYHGTWQVDLSEVVPDPRGEKKMSALGTWFTSNPSRAKDYGPNVYEIELPDDARFMSARTEKFERFWFDYELALKHLGLSRAEFAAVAAWVDQEPLPKNVVTRRMLNANREVPLLLRGMFRNWNYLTAVRSKIEDLGYQGVVWRDSTIDGGPPHDVYLYFGRVRVTRRRD